MEQDYYEEHVLSIITGRQGWEDEFDEISELKQQLNETDLVEEKLRYGWVLWREKEIQTSVLHKIITLLKHMAGTLEFRNHYIVQFWAVVGVEGRYHCLSALDHPFCVGDLKKGLSWYRRVCMDDVYIVDVEGGDELIGGIGRAYRNKQPESTPDLMLYSTHEFPMRDSAARCGLRSYLALPLFDSYTNQCYGVLELLSGYTTIRRSLFSSLNGGLQIAELRSTHINFSSLSRHTTALPEKYMHQPESEITKILEVAVGVVPELLLAQVWVPCKRCTNLRCMERASFILPHNKIANSCNGVDDSMFDFLQACEFHQLQIGFSYLGQSSCDLNIRNNPLAHYIAKARLSLCFAVCLKNEQDSNDHCVIEFFLQPICKEDAFSRDLLLSIIGMKLERFKLVSGTGEVDQLKQPNSSRSEFIDVVGEANPSMETFSVSDFTKFLETTELCCVRESEQRWIFHQPTAQEIFVNDVNNDSVKKVLHFLKEITVKNSQHDWIVQFWATRKVGRLFLQTSDQPFALSSLAKDLALLRKKCMQEQYCVDEEAKEEELGPLGRVFRNGHPEITPDLLLYTRKEFSVRKFAKHNLHRGYIALPVFEKHNDNKCVGVLEFIGFTYSEIGVIRSAMEVAQLRSTHHIHFRPRFIANHESSNISSCMKQALAEVNEAFSVIIEIPQLHMAKLWVPYAKCANNNNARCMALASSVTDLCNDMPRNQVRQIHVQPGKGIIGMVLASESKSCFCRSLGELSIADHPLAHYDRRESRDVCFAICLQSSHTEDLLYVLEFFLYPGPGTYDYLRTFLNFLLPILKQDLKSFKIASGKRLGDDELVIEVIEFSEDNRCTLSESNFPNVLPFRFESVDYGQKKHQDYEDERMESVSRATQTEVASDIKKYPRERNRSGRVHLSLQILRQHFGKKLKDVAEELGVGRSTIKRACRNYGINKWPCKLKQTCNPTPVEEGSAQYTRQDMQPSRSNNLQLSDKFLSRNEPRANKESPQHTNLQEAEKTMIKVRHEEDTIRFEICLSLGVAKLFEEVATRINLKVGTFKLKYLDEVNDDILLTCNADLLHCPKKTLGPKGKAYIQLFVQPIS